MLATEWSFGNVLWTMLVLFFWVMAIWIFITIFADIFRRNDLSGWAKAGWIFLIFIVPFLGALIYVIARPKMTAQDKEMIEQAQEAQRRIEGYSAPTRSPSSRSSAIRGRSRPTSTRTSSARRRCSCRDPRVDVVRAGPFGAGPLRFWRRGLRPFETR